MREHLTWRRVFLTALALPLFTGCTAAYMAENGPNSPWAQCENVDGGMAKSARVGSSIGQIAVGPVGGLVGLAMDLGHGQAVQDCRRKILEQAK